jgi:hypothetical protein
MVRRLRRQRSEPSRIHRNDWKTDLSRGGSPNRPPVRATISSAWSVRAVIRARAIEVNRPYLALKLGKFNDETQKK